MKSLGHGVSRSESVDLRARFESKFHSNPALIAEVITLTKCLGDHEDVGE